MTTAATIHEETLVRARRAGSLSIVLVSHDRPGAIAATLRELGAGEATRGVETVVVDNGSRDGTASVVEREFPSVRLVRLATNTGVAAFNEGVARTTGAFVLVLDDVQLQDDGQLAPLDDHGALGSFFGREGNTLLVNGRQLPTIDAQPGVPLRLRIVNAANARYFELGLAGHLFTRIGGDGGLLPHPATSETVLVVPGERADVILTPEGSPGDVLTMQWIPYERGYCAACRDPEDLMRVRLVESSAWTAPPLPATFRTIEETDMSGASEQVIQLTTGAIGGAPIMGINGKTFEETVPIEAMSWEKQIWTVVNTTEADHPFHLHGLSLIHI